MGARSAGILGIAQQSRRESTGELEQKSHVTQAGQEDGVQKLDLLWHTKSSRTWQ
jgi:hypothetical protein